MNPIAGHCGKCGAPYSYPSSTWGSILPQQPIPTCACWTKHQVYTITHLGGNIKPHSADCWKEHHECAINKIVKIQSGLSSAIKIIGAEPPSERRDCLLIIFALLNGIEDE